MAPVWWIPLAVEAARTLIELLRLGLKEKKKANKLEALVRAWEEAGRYKDLLLRLYEDGEVTEDRRAKARELRNMLDQLQQMLGEIRRKIRDDEDAARERDAAEELARRILDALVLF
ncbi:MAG: hypothetical protein HYT78_09070 [Deltaproteobacteria bacterium]|nr:hypothetical protein [Deltaproteobacteria bacterium]